MGGLNLTPQVVLQLCTHIYTYIIFPKNLTMNKKHQTQAKVLQRNSADGGGTLSRTRRFLQERTPER